ncbi:hydrogenase 4 subunit F [Anaerosinus massiliensis]|uniref:hydrogenase 4 subunit F n=1 Tax=Massilibacillus massiliensis TaxID=1806837 RepID=UPI000AC6D499|nr:hydrogenase 4 subunit F [Massilibacillus massiliensis]
MLVLGLLALPLLTGVCAGLLCKHKFADLLQVIGSLVTLCISVKIAWQVYAGQVLQSFGWFYVDALGAFHIVLIAAVGFAASLYSVGYMRYEVKEGLISRNQLGRYYFFFHFFILTMLFVSSVDNLGLLWVGIELTTLVSAMLVAFYGTRHALEAAWKYLIMGVVGIAFALLGIVFLYLSGLNSIGEHSTSALQWTQLFRLAEGLNPRWVEIGFIFILIGFGTKAGIAPMHFWLPDAHSQAPAPVSAVLSGVLLNTALYGLFRVYAIANVTLQGSAGDYLIAFGLFSIGVTVPFIMVQHDLKRMLAFSSVEHMGIITLAVGLGGTIGLYGAFLHMMNHSMTKSVLFFSAGNIAQKYHSKYMDRITGVVKVMPFTGGVFLLAGLAIAGAPPFSIFLSEFTIMIAGVLAGKIWASCIFALLIVLIFAGMSYYVVKMSFGELPARIGKKRTDWWMRIAMLLPLSLVILFGLYVPEFIERAVYMAAAVLQGGVK